MLKLSRNQQTHSRDMPVAWICQGFVFLDLVWPDSHFKNNIVLCTNINIYRFCAQTQFSHIFSYTEQNHSRNMPVPRMCQCEHFLAGLTFLAVLNNTVLCTNINIYRFCARTQFPKIFSYTEQSHSRNMPVPRMCQCKHSLFTITIRTGIFVGVK